MKRRNGFLGATLVSCREVCIETICPRRVGRKREFHEGVRERKRDSRRGHQAEIAISAIKVSVISSKQMSNF